MDFSFRKNALAVTAFLLLMTQIFCLLINIMYSREKYLVNTEQQSYIKYLYTSEMYLEEMKDRLEVIQYINETAYKDILLLAIQLNAKELLLLLADDVSRLDKMSDSDQQYMVNIIKTRLMRNFSKKRKMTEQLNFQKEIPNKTQPVAAKVVAINRVVLRKTKPVKANSTKKFDKPKTQSPIIEHKISRKPPIRKDREITDAHCVVNESELRGRENITYEEHGMNVLEAKFENTMDGGRWYPKQCTPTQRIAIIIPYRDRDRNLKLLLQNLIPKLRRQKVDYTFYVVEQASGSKFNRGMMRNIGFMEAKKAAKYDCYIFNDVDTLIEDDRNLYTCIPGAAYHIAVRVSKNKYRLLYGNLVGGILSFKDDLFLKANGYPNFFFIWGGEDDAMYHRMKEVDAKIVRPNFNVSHTTTIEHERDPKLKERINLLKRDDLFWKKDGLNSLDYQILVTEKRKLYTWIYVNVDQSKYTKMLQNYIEEMDRLLRPNAAPPSPQPEKSKQIAASKIAT